MHACGAKREEGTGRKSKELVRAESSGAPRARIDGDDARRAGRRRLLLRGQRRATRRGHMVRARQSPAVRRRRRPRGRRVRCVVGGVGARQFARQHANGAHAEHEHEQQRGSPDHETCFNYTTGAIKAASQLLRGPSGRRRNAHHP